MSMEKEFSPGDAVTYKPYETASVLEVKFVQVGAPFLQGDDRVFYMLGTPDCDKITTQTTGKCIVESKYYGIEEENQ